MGCDGGSAEAPVWEKDGFVWFECEHALFATGYAVRHAERLGGEGRCWEVRWVEGGEVIGGFLARGGGLGCSC